MKLADLNLGQIIGRLTYGAPEAGAPEAAPAAPAAAPTAVQTATAATPRQRGGRPNGRAARIRALLRQHPRGLPFGELVRALGEQGNDRELSGSLANMADVEKSGARYHYLYRLKENA